MNATRPSRPGDRRRAARLAACLLGALLLGACTERPQYAAVSDPVVQTSRTLEVVGQGEVAGDPRRATFEVLLRSRGEASQDAVADARTLERRLLKQLEPVGVRPVDVRYRGQSLALEDEGEAGVAPGYVLDRRLAVTVTDLDRLQRVLGVCATVGAERVDDLRFLPGNATLLQQTARESAVADAEARAQTLAQQLGMQVGPPVEIEELDLVSPGDDPDEPFTARCAVRVVFSMKRF